jgi:hypothetical protein
MLSTICNLVVPPGFEPRSEESESSMMGHYTKGLGGIGGRIEMDGKKRPEAGARNFSIFTWQTPMSLRVRLV